jgi:hypothetical protein
VQKIHDCITEDFSILFNFTQICDSNTQQTKHSSCGVLNKSPCNITHVHKKIFEANWTLPGHEYENYYVPWRIHYTGGEKNMAREKKKINSDCNYVQILPIYTFPCIIKINYFNHKDKNDMLTEIKVLGTLAHVFTIFTY